MARPSNTDERRAQIVHGLLRLLPTRGYANASIAAIAREAGLAPGLVHYHFGNKKQILVAAAVALGDLLRQRFDLRVSNAGTAEERLTAWVDAHLDLGDDADLDATAAWAALGAEAQRDEEVQGVYREFLGADRARLAELLAEVVPPERAAVLATMGVALVEGLFRVGTGAPGFVPPGTAAGSVRELLTGLIGAAK